MTGAAGDRCSGLKPHLTRDVTSAKAMELAALGAEVVAADVDDAASLERAFAGAYGAYCVTFFWVHFSPEKEMAEAVNLGIFRAGKEHVGKSVYIFNEAFVGARSVELSRRLNPELQTFDEWLEKNKGRIPLE